MSIERELAISILKLAKEHPVEQERINKDAKIPSAVMRNLLGKMQSSGLVYLRGGMVATEPFQRLTLALRAVEMGGDVERVASCLQWSEFERMAATVFEINGYRVMRNFRFKDGKKRWEIDVVACKRPMTVCIDCKHWHRSMFPSTAGRIAEQQALRARSLAESSVLMDAELPWTRWEDGYALPLVVSLFSSRFKFSHDIPMVSILQLQDFLMHLPAFQGRIRTYAIRRMHLA